MIIFSFEQISLLFKISPVIGLEKAYVVIGFDFLLLFIFIIDTINSSVILYLSLTF